MRLRQAAETQVRSGHPWVFADSIREQNRPGEAGELAVIFDRNDRFLAVGLFDPQSPIRVRVLHTGSPTTIDAEWFAARMAEACKLRRGLLDEHTNAARLINGESDRFPGLVLDRYADTLVLKLYSEVWFTWLPAIVKIIEEGQIDFRQLILRLSRNVQPAAARHKLHEGQVLWPRGGRADSPVIFLESGLRFEADVIQGQKTGFFLDQRENRRRVEALAASKEVLNAFSFSGGFSLYAARGGARSVTDVDISVHALESGRRNFALNPALAKVRHETVQADVFEWLRQSRAGEYDLVILDPPSLAKREAERAAALKAYGALATAGQLRTRRKGVLVCCSCSGHVRAAEFFETVIGALRRSGRKFRVLEQAREPLDHHATFPEAEYLKAIFLKLDEAT